MPTFLLDVHDGEVFAEDCKGFEALDEDVVYEQAVLALIDLAKEKLPSEGELKLVTTARHSSGSNAFTAVLSVTSKMTCAVHADTT
jgi:hypothetical protein